MGASAIRVMRDIPLEKRVVYKGLGMSNTYGAGKIYILKAFKRRQG
jgi:hypothetical protein